MQDVFSPSGKDAAKVIAPTLFSVARHRPVETILYAYPDAVPFQSALAFESQLVDRNGIRFDWGRIVSAQGKAGFRNID
jgi:hypothetical protein